MQIISSSEARTHLSAMIDKAQSEPVTIQKQGRNAAVLLSYEAYEQLTADPVRCFQSICDRIRKDAQERGLTEEIFNAIIAQKDA